MKGTAAFQHGLDNAIGRLAKKLPIGNLERQAAELGGESAKPAPSNGVGTAELDEDDLT